MRHSSGKTKVTRAVYVKLLEDVLGSPFAAPGAMLYSYRHEFSGFAARLTKAQAETVAAMRGVVYVLKSRKLELHTTRSWDFLGLSLGDGAQPPQYSKMGEGSIIGLIDTGFSQSHRHLHGLWQPDLRRTVYQTLGIRSTYMMARSYTISFVMLSFLIIISASSTITTNTKRKSEDAAHIVYMGHVSGESSKVTKAVHLKLLEEDLGSPYAARKAMLYSYKQGFSGFAARLTEGQAKIVAGAFQILTEVMPGVVYVSKSQKLELHTTRSWDFLGLSQRVWSESPSFKDETMGPSRSAGGEYVRVGSSSMPRIANGSVPGFSPMGLDLQPTFTVVSNRHVTPSVMGPTRPPLPGVPLFPV